jgi:4-carboxymuconolactone decarboxylase
VTDRHPLRLTPLPAEEWDDRARAALTSLIPAERAHPVGAGNVLSTLVRHPDLTRAYLPFNAYLLTSSTLSPRIREVALLRVVYRRDCDYLCLITFRSRAERD